MFLESLDEFTGTYFVGVPDVTTLPLLMFNASMGGNYQIASITALLLLVPSIAFMLVVERFLKADVLAMVGRVLSQSRCRETTATLARQRSQTPSGIVATAFHSSTGTSLPDSATTSRSKVSVRPSNRAATAAASARSSRAPAGCRTRATGAGTATGRRASR